MKKNKHEKTKKRPSKKKIALITIVSILGACLLFILTMSLILEPRVKIRGFATLNHQKLTPSSVNIKILDENDSDITGLVYYKKSRYTKITSLNGYTKAAFISIEDKKFYKHNGLDYGRIIKAAGNNIIKKQKHGGSTITQQLVKNTHLNRRKKLSRKLNEARIAKEIERKYSKDKILEFYLNNLDFGGGAIGIDSASRMFFNTTPENLTLAQSATLAAIINAPSYYSPLRNPERAKKRRNLVLAEMLKDKKITNLEYSAAIDEPLSIEKIKMPCQHYFNAVIKEVSDIYGISPSEAYSLDIVVKTHYNNDISNNILSMLPDFNDDALYGVVILDNKKNSVAALSGYCPIPLHSISRSPGSTIKPFISYAPCINKGIAYPDTLILDERTSFNGYSPKNYKDRYDGWTTVEDSLVNSSNIAAVKLLGYAGVENAKSYAKNFGFSFSKNDNSLALALGCMENGSSLLTLANAFQVFANNGLYKKNSTINYIADNKGNVAYRTNNPSIRAATNKECFFINRMLYKTAKEGTAKHLGIENKIVCAKTGTVGTKDGNTDAYSIFYTKDYTVVVWIGSMDNKQLITHTGGGTATLIARKILFYLPEIDSSRALLSNP